MLDNQDIQKLVEVFATKEEMKEMIANLATKEDFSDLQGAVDSFAKKTSVQSQEDVMLSHKVDRHEKWFQQVAQKIDIKLEY